MLLIFEIGAIAVILLVAYLATTLPDPKALDAFLAAPEPMAAADVETAPVPLSEVPKTLRVSVARVKGKSFFQPMQFDLLPLVRVLSGMSRMAHLNATVAERLAATLLPDPPLSDADLVRQWMLALRVESRYSPNQILEIYYNRISFGAGIVGVDAAAHEYFGKDVQALDSNQARELAVRVDLPAQSDRPDQVRQAPRPERRSLS